MLLENEEQYQFSKEVLGEVNIEIEKLLVKIGNDS